MIPTLLRIGSRVCAVGAVVFIIMCVGSMLGAIWLPDRSHQFYLTAFVCAMWFAISLIGMFFFAWLAEEGSEE